MDKLPSIRINRKIKINDDLDVSVIRIEKGQQTLFYKGKRFNVSPNEHQGANSSCFVLKHDGETLFLKVAKRLEQISFGLKGFSKIIDYGTACLYGEKRYFYIFEYISGKTLDALATEGTMPLAYYYGLLDIIKNVLRGGYLLFDFNMSNFVVDGSNNVYCVDYGAIVSIENPPHLSRAVAINKVCNYLNIEPSKDDLKANIVLVELALLVDSLATFEDIFVSEELNEGIKEADMCLLARDRKRFAACHLVKEGLTVLGKDSRASISFL